jgi:hypothetical protein
MTLCAACGSQLAGDVELRPHHSCVYGDDWAAANRIMCDFFHRGTVPPRLPEDQRDEDSMAPARTRRTGMQPGTRRSGQDDAKSSSGDR